MSSLSEIWKSYLVTYENVLNVYRTYSCMFVYENCEIVECDFQLNFEFILLLMEI